MSIEIFKARSCCVATLSILLNRVIFFLAPPPSSVYFIVTITARVGRIKSSSSGSKESIKAAVNEMRNEMMGIGVNIHNIRAIRFYKDYRDTKCRLGKIVTHTDLVSYTNGPIGIRFLLRIGEFITP